MRIRFAHGVHRRRGRIDLHANKSKTISHACGSGKTDPNVAARGLLAGGCSERAMNKLKAWIVANWTNILAQIGHFLAGYAIVLTVAVRGWPFWIAIVIVEGWSIPKEFWFDYAYED